MKSVCFIKPQNRPVLVRDYGEAVKATIYRGHGYNGGKVCDGLYEVFLQIKHCF